MKVCRGSSRLVLLIANVAIKFPRVSGVSRIRQGLRCNLAERSAWHEGVFPQLCPLLWSAKNGWVNVMARATVMTHDEFVDWCDSADWPDVYGHEVPFEYKARDAGYLPDGQRVMVDYGVLGYEIPDRELSSGV